MSYLGDRAEEGLTTNINHQQKMAWKFTTGLTAISPTFAAVQVKSTVGGAPNLTLAIYTDNAGAPNALVANSTLTLPTPVGSAHKWVGVRFTTSPTLTANTTYWLCLQVEGAPGDRIGIATAAGAVNQQCNSLADPLPLSDPYGGPLTYGNFTASVFVEDDAGGVIGSRMIESVDIRI